MTERLRLVAGGDHAGFALKYLLIDKLRGWGYEVTDVGSHGAHPVDFPDIADRLCGQIRSGEAERGIMVCGTGVGAAIAANKYPGVRAALCHDTYSAHQCVEHDDVNVLCLGAQIVGECLALELLSVFLRARHSDHPDFTRRLTKLAEIERRFSGAG